MNTIQAKYVTDQCGICWGDYQTNDRCLELKCGHLFHQKCFTEFFVENSSRIPRCFLCNRITRLNQSTALRSLRGTIRPISRAYIVTFAIGCFVRTSNKFLYHYMHYHDEDTSKICPAPWRQKAYITDQTILMCWFSVFVLITFVLLGKVFKDCKDANLNTPKEIRFSKN